MNFRDAQNIASDAGYRLTRYTDEYRLAPMGVSAQKAERRAYYSDDLADVMGTLDAELRHNRRRAA